MNSFPTRLRTWLVVMALVALLPAVGATLYIQATERRAARERTIAENLRLVRLAAGRQAALFDGAHRLLLTLSKFLSLSATDPAACTELLAKVLADHPEYFNLAVANADGALFCAGAPLDPAQFLTGRRRIWFERATAARTSVVGEYQTSATSGKPAFVVAQPLLDRFGAVRRVIGASIAADQLNRVAAEADFPPGATLTLFDRSRTILVRFPEAEGLIGRQVPETDALRRMAAGATDVISESVGLDGVRRLYVGVPVRAAVDTGLYIGMGVEYATVFQDADRTFQRYIWLLGLVSVISIVAATAAGQMFVLKPVTALTNETDRAECALRETEDRYRQLFEQNPHPMWLYDRLTLEFLEVNEAAVRAYGYSRDEFLAMRITDIRPPEDVPKLVASLEANREPWARASGWRHRLKSGEIIDVEVTSHVFTFEGRSAELVTAQNVTDRTRAEAALAERTTITALTADVGVALNLPHDLKGCLRSCAEAVVAHLDAASTQIWTSDHETGSIELQAQAGESTPADRLTIAGIAQDRRPQFTEGFAGCPLMIGSRVVGVLTVCGSRFSDAVMSGVASVAEVIALGIERHWADEARRNSERRFELIAGTITQVFWIADVNIQTMLYVSPAYESIWDRSCQSLYDDPRSFLEAVHPHDRARVIETLGIQQSGQLFSHEYRIVRPDREIRWVWDRGYPVRPADGGRVTQYVGVAQDITDRRRAEEQIRLLARAIESTNDLVSVTDANDCITFANPAFLRAYGYAPEEVIGQTPPFLRSPQTTDAVAADILRASRAEGWSGELLTRRKDGTEFFVDLHTSAIRDDRGEIVGLLGVARDVTERRSLEEQLRQAQKMEAIGQLAGGIAHDFNNLLTAIQGFADLLAVNLEPGDARRDDVDEIQRAAERAAALTRQLLAFSRKQILSVRVLHVGDVIGELTPMLRRLLGETIDLKTTASDRGMVKADPGQLQQVLVNLAVNARDAMGDGGRLTIETADVMLDEAFARRHPSVSAGPHVRLAVTDNGCGMDAATRKRIFEPFFTTKPKDRGTGLGLATVYGIVKQSGGSIWVYSEVGRGTTFKVYLPRTNEAPPADAPARVDRRSLRGAETILLVEDEGLVREYVYKILSRQGYSVRAEADPMRAIEYAEAHHAPIDLVFTDVVLPAMSGPSMISRLQQRHPEAKVLYMSGYADDAIVHHGVLEAGASFLQKPFNADALARKVRDVLDAQHP